MPVTTSPKMSAQRTRKSPVSTYYSLNRRKVSVAESLGGRILAAIDFDDYARFDAQKESTCPVRLVAISEDDADQLSAEENGNDAAEHARYRHPGNRWRHGKRAEVR
jgi:hypothetical protein